MSVYDEDQDERMRYGLASDCCPLCHQLRALCAFHREVEANGLSYQPTPITNEQINSLLASWDEEESQK
jgi:hypothetical protein